MNGLFEMNLAGFGVVALLTALFALDDVIDRFWLFGGGGGFGRFLFRAFFWRFLWRFLWRCESPLHEQNEMHAREREGEQGEQTERAERGGRKQVVYGEKSNDCGHGATPLCGFKDRIQLFPCHKLRDLGIKGKILPHTRSMDKNKSEQDVKTEQGEGIVIPSSEAEEYCLFKRQKRVAEAAAAFSRSETEGGGDGSAGGLKRLCEGAKRTGSAAVRVTPNFVAQARGLLAGSKVAVDCVTGGTGETTARVKAYEAKRAIRDGAREITLVICGSALKNERTGEIKKEVKRVVRAAKKVAVKVAAGKDQTYAELLKLAKLTAECGGKFLSVPFFAGAEALKRDMRDCCMLEVRGVTTAADYKILAGAGVERIATVSAEEIYAELMTEAERCSFSAGEALPTFARSEPIAPSGGGAFGTAGVSGAFGASGTGRAGEKYGAFFAAAPFGIAERVARREGENGKEEK